MKTDWRGYAIIPYASAYRNNRIALNPDSFNDNTEIKNNVQNVVPISGAVARATFDTSIGIRALLSLTHNGKPIRFGSMVQETGSQISSIADDDGRVYLTGLPLTGKLLVQWGISRVTSAPRIMILPVRKSKGRYCGPRLNVNRELMMKKRYAIPLLMAFYLFRRWLWYAVMRRAEPVRSLRSDRQLYLRQ